MITSAPSPLPRPARCPVCGKPAVAPHRPFCSARCRNIDLGRWLKEGYRIESDESPQDDSEEGN
jgi:endogenous inhibitor of DNA gyrase (YacG/DUF329 family)